MALKKPDMSKNTPKLKCCDGPNKGKLFEADNACDDDKDIFDAEKCECVECRDTGNTLTSLTCQARGYNSCYVCREGKCVKGPRCCSNLPGKNVVYGCKGYTLASYDGPGPPDPDEDDCCAHEWKAYLFHRDAYTHSYDGAYRGGSYCESGSAGPDRIWFLAVDCEEIYIQEVRGVSRLAYNGGWPEGLSGYYGSCGRRCAAGGMPPSCVTFEYSTYTAYAVSPGGTTRILYGTAATQERYSRPGFNTKLAQRLGDTNFNKFLSGAFVGWPYQPVWKSKEFRSYWVIASGTYNNWAPDAGPMQITEYPTCWPYEDKLSRCYCSGQSLQQMIDEGTGSNFCSLCYGGSNPLPRPGQ